MTDQTAPKILTRDDLLSAKNLQRELVEVPDLGGSIWMRELSSGQLVAFNARVLDLRAQGVTTVTAEISIGLMALIVSMSACDQDGRLLFTEADVNDLLINRVNVLQTLAEKAQELSGLQANLGDAMAGAGDGLTSPEAEELKKSPIRSSS